MKVLGLTTRVGQRFLAILLAISLLPLIAVSYFGVRVAESILSQQTLLTVRTASDGADAQLREFLKNFKGHMLMLSEDERIRQPLESMTSATLTAPSLFPDLSKLLAERRRRIPEVQELFIIAPEGRVVASSDEEDVAKNVSGMEYFIRAQKGFFGDVFRDKSGRVTCVMALPVQDPGTYRVVGVLAFRIDPSLLSALTTGRRVLAAGAATQVFRIGDTGETYIVNRDHLMITESRSIANAILRVKVDTLPVRVAFEQGREITANYKDYRGVETSGSSTIFRDLGWVLITEIDFSQAFAPIRRLCQALLGATIGVAFLVVILAWDSTRRIMRPVRILSESDRALAIGDKAAAEISEEGLPHDELGDFVRQRNARVKAIFAYQQQLDERTAKLKEALAELEHMSYSIIHDMRAPLRALIAFGSMILDEEAGRLSSQGQDYLGRMRAAASRMDHLIRDVLSYSVIARSELPLHPINVSGLIRGIVETYPAVQESKAEICVEGDSLVVQGNEAALTQCFANLLDNAIKFVAPGQVPRVEIRGERVNNRVRIWVEDNGVGIPPGMCERVFRIFERGNNIGDSTGIGLAIVRKAVERMGGRVGVVSEPGRGSRFWIELQSPN